MVNILVVDDEPDIGELYRQHFRKELKDRSVKLFVANSATEALVLLTDIDRLQPLVIFTDINMPGMNGIELLKTIKEQWPGQHTIMVSAYAGNEDFQRDAAKYKADDFMSKPINFDQIKSRVHDFELN